MCGSGQVQGVQEMENSGIFWLDIDHIVTVCHQIYQSQEDVHIKCCRVKGCKRNGVGLWGKAAGPESRTKCADPRLA